MPEKFDFTKEDDQKAFLAQPKDEQEVQIEIAHEEGLATQEGLEEFRDELNHNKYGGHSGEITAHRLADELDLPKDAVKRIAQDTLSHRILRRTSLGYLDKRFELSKEQVRAAATQAYLESLAIGDFINARSIAGEFELEDEKFAGTNEIKEAAEKGVAAMIKSGDIGSAQTIRAYFELPDTLLQTKAAQDAALKVLPELLKSKDGNPGWFRTIVSEFKLPNEQVEGIVFSTMLEELKNGSPEQALKIKKRVNLPDELIQREEVKIAALSAFARKVKQKYLGGDPGGSFEFKEAFNLGDEETTPMVKKVFEEYLYEGNLETALAFSDKFSLPKELLRSEEMQSAVINGFIKACTRRRFSEIVKIYEMCDIPENRMQEQLNNFFPAGYTVEDLKKHLALPQIGEKLIESLTGLQVLSYSEHALPIINAQGPAAFLYLDAMKNSVQISNQPSDEEINACVSCAKRYGTQARSVLTEIILVVDNATEHKDVIDAFMQEIGVIDLTIYNEYFSHKDDPEYINKLKERVGKLQQAIYDGEVGEHVLEDPLASAVAYHVFPPAVGVSRDQYVQLIERREERYQDVPKGLDTLQREKIEVPTGTFSIGDETLELGEWQTLGEVIKRVNLEEKSGETNEIANIGEQLIALYKSKDRDDAKLYELMYRYHLKKGGAKLPESYELNPAGLMAYKEFIGDRIKNDLVRDAIADYKEKHGVEWSELVVDINNRSKGEQVKTLAMVKNMLGAIKKQQDEEKKTKAIAKLNDLLLDYGYTYESVQRLTDAELQRELSAVTIADDGNEYAQTEEYYNSPEFTSAYDQFVAVRNPEANATRKIASDLVAETNRNMRKELDKFTFEEAEGGAKTKQLEFMISKSRAHGVAGFTMGVCVTPDETLWNDENFWNVLLMDPDQKQNMGGFHALVRDGWLTLPGINPSLEVLGTVDNEALYDACIEYAKKIAEKLNLWGVLIPTEGTIHSNRTQIGSIITKRSYPTMQMDMSSEFAYSPYKYSFKETYLAWKNPNGARGKWDGTFEGTAPHDKRSDYDYDNEYVDDDFDDGIH